MKLRRAIAIGAMTGTMLFPFAILAFQVALSRDWVPDRPYETIHFLNYEMPDAMRWYYRLAVLDVVWSALFLGAVLSAPVLRERFGRRFLPALIVAQSVALLVMLISPFPMDSDQFAYVYYGNLTLRGVNPYPQYTAPLQLQGEERRVAVHWNNPPYVDRYGPAWSLANAAALWPVRHTSAEVQARVLRALAAVTAVACTLLLSLALPRAPWRDASLVAFALNPLIIAAVGNGGHNDIYLLFFGLLAWLFATRLAYEWAAAALATAVSIKFAYALLVPTLLAFTYVRSRSIARVATAMAAFIAPVVLYSLPLGVRDSLIAPVIGWNSDHPPHISYFIWRIFAHVPHLHAIPFKPFTPIVPLCASAVALAIAFFAMRGRRQPVLEMTLAVLILLLPYKVENWYVIMLVPLLLVPSRFALTMFLAITLASQYLQMRIFVASSGPYVIFTALAVLIAALLEEYLQNRRGWTRTAVIAEGIDVSP